MQKILEKWREKHEIRIRDKICFKDLLPCSNHYDVEGQILAKELKTFYDDQSKYKRRADRVEIREKKVFELMIKGLKQKEMVPILGSSQRVIAYHMAVIRERVLDDWVNEGGD
jgi:hypothetical protein